MSEKRMPKSQGKEVMQIRHNIPVTKRWPPSSMKVFEEKTAYFIGRKVWI